MTKQSGGRREAPPPGLTDFAVLDWTVHKRAESNPVRRYWRNASTEVRKPAAVAQLEAR
jgi:hypothetical protein